MRRLYARSEKEETLHAVGLGGKIYVGGGGRGGSNYSWDFMVPCMYNSLSQLVR